VCSPGRTVRERRRSLVPKEVAVVVVVVVVVIAKEDFLLAEQCLFGAGASSMSDLLLMVHVEEAVVY